MCTLDQSFFCCARVMDACTNEYNVPVTVAFILINVSTYSVEIVDDM